MADATIDLLKAHFRRLRLPTMSQEFEKLARDAAATNQHYFQFLLRLTELELGTRATKCDRDADRERQLPGVEGFRHIRLQRFTCHNFPSRRCWSSHACEWIEHKYNCCLVGSQGTGKTHIAVALGQAACQQGLPCLLLHGGGVGESAREGSAEQYTLG